MICVTRPREMQKQLRKKEAKQKDRGLSHPSHSS